MDVSGAAELYVNRFAREIAPVRLTGNYGTEIVRSKVVFRPGAGFGNIFDPEFAKRILKAATTYSQERAGRIMSFIAFKQVPWHHYARLSLEQSQLTPRSPFLDNELVSLVYQAPPEVASGKELSLRLIHDGNPSLSRIPTDRGLTYPQGRVAGKIDAAFREFLAKVEYAYDYGMPDWLARSDRALGALHLERLFLGHQKFCHFRIWYRDYFAAYVKEILLDSRTLSRGYLNPRLVRERVEGHLDGKCNFTLGIQKILSMELMHRLLIEQN
jgi:asparagine synthase (glutamine-hydrolysing)